MLTFAPVREHVIETAVADVVGPAVAADQPDALLHQVVGERLEAAGLVDLHAGQLLPQRDDAFALRCDAGLARLIRVEERR